MNNKPEAVKKTLTANDTGITGSHQAGILIPKKGGVLEFFPDLNENEKNPRASITFIDDSGNEWRLNFIHYNNKLMDHNGTRNEYRLTGMTAYIKENRLKVGDSIILRRNDDGNHYISYSRISDTKSAHTLDTGEIRIDLQHTWTVINI